MISRLLLGAPGKENPRRLRGQLIMSAVWIVISAVEMVITSKTPQLRVLSIFWAFCLVFWAALGSFALRLALERRKGGGVR